jgi:hypothetical protein
MEHETIGNTPAAWKKPVIPSIQIVHERKEFSTENGDTSEELDTPITGTPPTIPTKGRGFRSSRFRSLKSGDPTHRSNSPFPNRDYSYHSTEYRRRPFIPGASYTPTSNLRGDFTNETKSVIGENENTYWTTHTESLQRKEDVVSTEISLITNMDMLEKIPSPSEMPRQYREERTSSWLFAVPESVSPNSSFESSIEASPSSRMERKAKLDVIIAAELKSLRLRVEHLERASADSSAVTGSDLNKNESLELGVPNQKNRLKEISYSPKVSAAHQQAEKTQKGLSF